MSFKNVHSIKNDFETYYQSIFLFLGIAKRDVSFPLTNQNVVAILYKFSPILILPKLRKFKLFLQQIMMYEKIPVKKFRDLNLKIIIRE